MTAPPPARREPVVARLTVLDRFLPVWILAAMATGVALGQLIPRLNHTLSSVQITHTSLPIALGLLTMMYPVLARVRYEENSRGCATRSSAASPASAEALHRLRAPDPHGRSINSVREIRDQIARRVDALIEELQ